jgi:hypothetical protein
MVRGGRKLGGSGCRCPGSGEYKSTRHNSQLIIDTLCNVKLETGDRKPKPRSKP